MLRRKAEVKELKWCGLSRLAEVEATETVADNGFGRDIFRSANRRATMLARPSEHHSPSTFSLPVYSMPKGIID